MIHREEPPSADSAKAIIASAFPQFRGLRVRLLDEGWDFRVFEVDGTWVFRFPKHDKGVTKLRMELQLLSTLGEWVSLPVPTYEHIGESSKGSSRPFAGYRKIPGIPGDLSEMVDLPTIARQLGSFLGKLHAFPVDRATKAGVREETSTATHRRDKSIEESDRITDLPVDADRLRHYLERNAPPPLDGVPKLVHNDLWAEHILIDPRSGEVSGIIDWGDAVIGDPAVDFAGLYTWRETLLEAVLEHYSGAHIPDAISRARYLATCLAVHNISLGQDMGYARWVKTGREVLLRIFRG